MEDVAINITKLSAVCHEMSMISNGVIESEHDNRIGSKSFKEFYDEELYLHARIVLTNILILISQRVLDN